MKIPQRNGGAGRRLVRAITPQMRAETTPRADGTTTDFDEGGARYRSGVLRARALDTRSNPFHFILAVQFQLFQLDLFQEVFRTEVGFFEDSLQLCVVLLMLLKQTLIIGVCIEEYVPRAPLHFCHAFLLRTAD